MEIMIEISEEDYKSLKDGHIPFSVLDAIKNGTPLPKNHGRLIDADALNRRMEQRIEEIGDDKSIWEASGVEIALDMFAPTIIEAEVKTDDKS